VPLSSADGLQPGLHDAYELWAFAATLVGAVAVLEIDARPAEAPGAGEPMLISEADGEHDVHGCWKTEDLGEGVQRLTFVAAPEVASSRLWLWREETKAVELPPPALQFVAPAVVTEEPEAPDAPVERFESVFDRDQLGTGAFEPPVVYEPEADAPDAWPSDERTGGFAVMDLRHITANVQRQHLPAIIALAAAFIAFLLIAFTGVGPTTF
jgi:hypothetical protein